ncbi:hypothetical protein ColTof4_05146 [Colletotrichum tofieldiae]|nr:hypothetical protein ColTof3_10608 [Colletotrichum tofieldiae]GKT72723.1 hypothetical protein ColTof4_05146 [Colletotrichum tofieldiae]
MDGRAGTSQGALIGERRVAGSRKEEQAKRVQGGSRSWLAAPVSHLPFLQSLPPICAAPLLPGQFAVPDHSSYRVAA